MMQTQTIADIVSLDDKAQFRNDVQLDAYDNPTQNIPLLHSFLFSSATPGWHGSAARSMSSLGLFNEVVDAFLSERLENRLTVVANFGHGKSHLALVLANYFGRPVGSEEVNIVIEKIHHVAGDSKGQRFRDFKDSRGEFLVIRLRGDVPQRLSAQFLLGLEKALDEHEATKGEKLPFWQDKAEKILSALTDEQRRKADVYLKGTGSDIVLLRKQVRDRQDVFDQVVGTIDAATGIRPDLREVSLSQAIEWATGNFVGANNVLGGILILFDEFSLYINQRAHRNAAAHLQDLLNGVEKSQGKVVFLAFAQFSPRTTVGDLSLNRVEREDLTKALTRLPKEFALHSIMESVIDAYLKQPQDPWKKFLGPDYIKGRMYRATEVAWDRFRNRYDRELRWSFEDFQETVTFGSFPLHPITTAMLCNLTMGVVPDSGVPRTVLGFVMDQLGRKSEEMAVVDRWPNWVLPIALVDYFKGRLDSDLDKSYHRALRKMGADLTIEQEAILKALLLQEMANITARPDEQLAFLQQSAGLREAQTQKDLVVLTNNKSIKQDPLKKTYSMWPVTDDPEKLEKLLKKKLEGISFGKEELGHLNSLLQGKEFPDLEFGNYPLKVDWGHPDNWAAAEMIVSADALTRNYIRGLVKPTRFDAKGSLQETSKGYVLWLLARDEKELEQLRGTAANVLNTSLGKSKPYPIVMILPDAPQPNLVKLFQRRQALRQLNNNEREEIGIDMFLHERDQADRNLVNEINILRGSSQNPLDLAREPLTILVPQAYQGSISALPKGELRKALDMIYKMAYVWRPPEFDVRASITTNKAYKYHKAIKTIAETLLGNSPTMLRQSTNQDPIARDMRDRFLIKKWGILTPDYRIQKPAVFGVVQAWDFLDRTFAAGKKDVRLTSVLIEFLNPPFGFDYNTALLLFSAWFGFTRADLQIEQRGHVVSPETIRQLVGKRSREFFVNSQKSVVSISRRDHSEVEKKVKKLIRRVQTEDFYQPNAKTAITELRAFAEDKRAAAELRDTAIQRANDLELALENAIEYDKQAVKLQKEAGVSLNLGNLLTLYRQIPGLPTIGNVRPVAPAVDKLRDQVMGAMEVAVNKSIEKYGQLNDLTNYQLKRQHLISEKQKLKKAGISALAIKLHKAISSLEARARELKKLRAEAPIRAEIDAMRTDIPLLALYESHTKLKSYGGYSDDTMAARDRKLAATEKKIEDLEKATSTFQDQVEQCTDANTLKKTYDNLMRISNRYEGTDFFITIESLREQIEALRSYLIEVRAVRHSLITTPADADSAFQKLDQLETNESFNLSNRQAKLVTEARQHIEAQTESQRVAAVTWLETMELTFRDASNLARLPRQLNNPHPFLPDSAQERLDILIQEVDQQLDADLVANIETKFLQINDQVTRQQCIERLENLMIEEPATQSVITGA